MIEVTEHDNEKFRKASLRFLKHAQNTINPSVTAADVREMLIQHILTEEIFSQVYDDSNFHRQNKDTANIQLDSETQLTGVPSEAWDYKLGNRSALEWILDQYKEKTPKDPTIREKFNTYRFADHKEKVIDLLKRVTRVSVETMKLVEAMRELPR